MKLKNYLYRSGEFAKLTGVNKRTLHYYNDIGLFCPEIIGENGYHYYTCFQFAQLELILTLRKIGMPIEEIREYVAEPSDASFTQMMKRQKQMIDDSIKQLLATKEFLEQKAERLTVGLEARHGVIEVCSLPKRKIIYSSPIEGTYDENDFAVAAEFSLRLKEQIQLYDNFGSCISMDAVNQKQFHNYSSFFAYCPDSAEIYDEILPAGKYLRAFCVGEWKKLPEIYQFIIDYAESHQLKLTGYAYEEGLNEIAIKTKSDYVTMITIRCENT